MGADYDENKERGMVLARRLKDLELTQTEFGRRLDPPVTQPVISQWLNGKEPVPTGRYEQIADVLQIKVDELDRPTPFVRTVEQINEWRDALMMNTPHLHAMVVLSSFPKYMRSDGECHVTEEEIAQDVDPITLDAVISAWPAVLNSPFVERVGSARWVFRLKFPEDT